MIGEFTFQKITADLSKKDAGDLCKHLREDAGLNTQRLSTLMDVSHTHIERVEKGNHQSLHHLMKMVEKYDNLEAKIVIRVI